MREAFTCKWGPHFTARDFAIQARYFQKWGTLQKSFVHLDKSKLAFVAPEFTMAVKFAMPF